MIEFFQSFSGEKILNFLNSLNSAGFWNFFTALAAINLSYLFWFKYRKRLPLFSVHVSYYCGTGHELFPNTLNFEVRNLMDSPIVVSRPNFRFSKNLKPGNNAHGNSATGDFEIKFRHLDESGNVKEGHSYTSILLRHRDSAFAYIAFQDSLKEEGFKLILNRNKFIERLRRKNRLGKLYLDVVVLKETKPLVVRMTIPVDHIHKHHHVPPLGKGGHPKNSGNS